MTGALRPVAARVVTRVLGCRPLAAAWRRVRPGLRILAYHGVPDARRFGEQLDLLVEGYTPVSGAEVLAARRGGPPLPDDAVWITFDDGDPTVLAHARAALVERGVPATLFVCPGLISAGDPPWWEIVLAAGAQGRGAVVGETERRGAALVTALKHEPDDHRREVVAALARELDRRGAGGSLTLDDVRRWQADGLEVGNHTWDHPCLDRCSADEQTRQIVEAHDWLARNVDPPELLFAYPNGDHTDHALGVLKGLGYGPALLFDHRLNARDAVVGSDELSRVRLDASASVPRARAIVAGVHPDLYSVTGRRRRRPG